MSTKPTPKGTAYLKRIEDVTKKVAESNESSLEQVEDIIDHFFHSFKEFITDPRMPKIKIKNWGSFKPSIKKINRNIRHVIELYHKNVITREKATDKIKHLWPIRNRLINENRGVMTIDAWRGKKDTMQQKVYYLEDESGNVIKEWKNSTHDVVIKELEISKTKFYQCLNKQKKIGVNYLKSRF